MMVMEDTHSRAWSARLASVPTGASRGVERAGAENDSSAQSNTDDVGPDLVQAGGWDATKLWCCHCVG